MNLSDYVNDVGSILLSNVQTELFEDPEIPAYREYLGTHGHLEGNDINLSRPCFLLSKVLTFISRRMCSGRLIMSILCLRTQLSF